MLSRPAFPSPFSEARNLFARSRNMVPRPLDAAVMLEAEMSSALDCLERYRRAQGAERRSEIAARACEALKIYSSLEEEYFHPAARAFLAEDVVDEAAVDLAALRQLVSEIEGSAPGEPYYEATITVLREFAVRRAHMEVSAFFPACRKAGMPVQALAARMSARKSELSTRLRGRDQH